MRQGDEGDLVADLHALNAGVDHCQRLGSRQGGHQVGARAQAVGRSDPQLPGGILRARTRARILRGGDQAHRNVLAATR